MPQSPRLPHSVQLPFTFLFNPLLCQRTQIQSHNRSNKARKGKGIASLVLSAVQSSNFRLFYFSPPRLLFPRRSVIFSVKGGRQKSEERFPCKTCAWGVAAPTAHRDKPWGSQTHPASLESLWQPQDLGNGAVRKTSPWSARRQPGLGTGG